MKGTQKAEIGDAKDICHCADPFAKSGYNYMQPNTNKQRLDPQVLLAPPWTPGCRAPAETLGCKYWGRQQEFQLSCRQEGASHEEKKKKSHPLPFLSMLRPLPGRGSKTTNEPETLIFRYSSPKFFTALVLRWGWWPELDRPSFLWVCQKKDSGHWTPSRNQPV